jgi:4a-hydroxytetrahydrobiopterin dehydratase
MARRRLLSGEQVEVRLAQVPQWKRAGKAITRTWILEDFRQALAFINRVGGLAEAMDHHPDICNSWATVTLSLTTHDAGGLTDRDFDLARQIDGLPWSPTDPRGVPPAPRVEGVRTWLDPCMNCQWFVDGRTRML